ncbi:MAG: hypothetical protein U5L75_00265 [Candidatus Campbellbacteria bacterium]|nr:hypothetical protein [Candidatus Campbellbacteria bacterium]
MAEFVARLNAVIINPLIVLLFALAALVFAWGLLQFVANSSNDEAREKGKKHMLYGILGIFIMVAAVSLINLVLNTFGISTI